MIRLLEHRDAFIAQQIFDLFQCSYKIEADLLGIPYDQFPPLVRRIAEIQRSETSFYGYRNNNQLLGVIEINLFEASISIDSVVVHYKHFRKGIGKELISYIINQPTKSTFIVQTGLLNKPAILLYQQQGFVEVKRWQTSTGVDLVQLTKSTKRSD